MDKYTKWVALWGNAASITEQREAMYAKDLTLRYPIKAAFSGNKLRFHFSNLTGTDPVEITKARVDLADETSKGNKTKGKPVKITFGGNESVTMEPGGNAVSDEIDFEVSEGEKFCVSLYLGGYSQMNTGVLITGPLSGGYYAYGDFAEETELSEELSRETNWYFFMDTIDILTEEKNKALICFGDSITAQSWPDYLQIKLKENGVNNVSVIRRAVSGTRILREYDCITYAAYGLKGETRFPIEIEVAGADEVIIQHGINDIIHPVGEEINKFRPITDLPGESELIDGIKNIYVKTAREKGLKIYGGTLLPINGWRTYAPFREMLKGGYNEWIRTTDVFDGVIDFDEAVRDEEDPTMFKKGFDSGDHLHPSEKAYKAMAEKALQFYLNKDK